MKAPYEKGVAIHSASSFALVVVRRPAKLEKRNKNPKPFVWTADADMILGKVERLCKRISRSGLSLRTLEAFTRLDANIRVAGDPDTIREAQRRCTIDQPLSPIALKVRRLSQTYDNWFLLVKPFSVFAAMPADVADTTGLPLKYRHDVIDAVEEISGGVRFGTINEFYLEAVFETQKTPGPQPL